MNLNFLDVLVLAENEEENERFVKTQKTPIAEGVCLRVFKDGSVYPSRTFVNTYNLQYGDVGENNQMDVVEAHQWGDYPKEAPNIVLIGFCSRSLPKGDIFNRGNYTSSAGETSDVMTQGSLRPDFINTLTSVYGESIWNTQGYVDLTLDTDHALKTNNGIYYIPKKVTRGEKAGTTTTERREYTEGLFPLIPFNTEGQGDESTLETEETNLEPQTNTQ